MCRSSTTSAPGAAEDGLSLQTMLELVAHQYRRALLEHFKETGKDTCSFEEAAEHVLDRHVAGTGDGFGTKAIKTSLLHVHLPKFEEAGVIEFDQRSQTIRYHSNDRLEALEDCLRSYQLE